MKKITGYAVRTQGILSFLVIAVFSFFVGLKFGQSNSIRSIVPYETKQDATSDSETLTERFSFFYTAGNRTYYVHLQDKFTFSFPSTWKYAENTTKPCLAMSQDFIDILCLKKRSGAPPEEGFISTYIGKNTFSRIDGLPVKEALVYEEGRSAYPLVEQEYSPINGVPSYRVVRQIKKGQIYMGATTKIAGTSVWYRYLKDGVRYDLEFDIKSNSPQNIIQEIDSVGRSFRIID